MKQFKTILSGGGTGGHIFPALAIANAIKSDNGSAEILFVGASRRMEMKRVPKAGFQIKGLWISGIQRKLSVQNLLFPLHKTLSCQDGWVVVVTLWRPCGVYFLCAGVVVELCRLRHSAAESLFFNFTLAKIDEKSLGRGSGVSWASLVFLCWLSGCSWVSFWVSWVVDGVLL